MGRRSKKLSREEQMEVEEWIYQNNTEEKRISDNKIICIFSRTGVVSPEYPCPKRAASPKPKIVSARPVAT